MKLSVSNKICLLSDCTYSWCIRCWLVVVVVVLLKSESISKHTFMLDHECQYLKTLFEYTFPHTCMGLQGGINLEWNRLGWSPRLQSPGRLRWHNDAIIHNQVNCLASYTPSHSHILLLQHQVLQDGHVLFNELCTWAQKQPKHEVLKWDVLIW